MKVSQSKTLKLFGRIASVTAALLFSCFSVFAQTTPPMMVQVPWVSVAAGGTACGTGLPIMGSSSTGLPTGSNYGDGCLPSQVSVSTPYGNAVDAWGNVYFSDEGHKYVRVIYAGPVTVGGVLNPAGAMISAAYGGRNVTPTAGYVYDAAGGYTAALAGTTTFYCTNNGTGAQASTADGAGCPATYSYISKPYAPAVDSAGNLFIPDESNKVVYVVIANANSPAAELVTVENPSITNPQQGYIYKLTGGNGYVDKQLASTANAISIPYGVAVDADENVYIADYTNDAIRMINGPGNSTSGGVAAGFIHTIGGNCTTTCTALSGAPGSGVPAIGAAFVDPMGIAVDGSGNVYVGDNSGAAGSTPSTVRVIYSGAANNPIANLICLENTAIENCSTSLVEGDVYTIAGSGTSAGSSATGNGGLATKGTFDKIQGVALDAHGNVYIADYSSKGLIAEVNADTGYLLFLAGDSPSTLAANNNCASGATAGAGPTMSDAYGDGCPATESVADHIEGNPAFDASGNLYFSDSGDSLIRKLTFNGSGTVGGSFPATVVGGSSTQSLAFELLAGTATAELASNPTSGAAVSVVTQGIAGNEFVNATTGDTCTPSIENSTLSSFTTTSVGTVSSSTANTTCVIPIKFTPASVGMRSGAVQIAATVNSTSQVLATAYLGGVGNGAALAIDPGTPSPLLGSGSNPAGVATDSVPNVYIAWANGTLTSAPGGPFSTNPGTGLSSPNQVAVDGAGNVYVADTGNDRIAEFVAGASVPVTIVGGLSSPKGVAVDAQGNLYIANTGTGENGTVLFQPNGNGALTQIGSSFNKPVSVAVAANGNVYVADSGSNEIVELTPPTGPPETATWTQTTVSLPSNALPVSVAVDAAGNLEYVDDSTTPKEVVEIPAVGGANDYSVTASGFTTPVAVALDSNGGLYVADSLNTGISYFNRLASSLAFTSDSEPLLATLTDIGNQPYTYSGTYTAPTDFTLAAAGNNPCNSIPPPLSLDPGANCGLSGSFTPGTDVGSLSNSVTFSGNAINGIPVLNFSGTVLIGTTTSLGNLTPAAPVYGQSVQVTVTVAANGSTPTGTALLTVDGVTQSQSAACTLTGSGSCILTLPWLSAGSHTVSATYTPTGVFSTSTGTFSGGVNVAVLPLTATANPITVAVNQAIPAITGSLIGVLTPDLANVTANFTTTATSSSPVGTYPISVSLTGIAANNYSVTMTGSPVVTINSGVVGSTTSIVPNVLSSTYGQPANVTANVAATSGSNAPTGSVTFTVDGGTPSSCTLVPGSGTSSTCSYSTPAFLAAGPHSISASYLSTGNFSSSSSTSPASLQVAALAITATANPVTSTYGATVPTITGSLSGVVNGDNVSPVFTSSATAASAVGSYPVGVGLTGPAAGNYTVTMSSAATVTIQAAPVSVVVTSTSRNYGAANPTFSGTLGGVLPGDTANVAATYSTNATVTSAAGGTYTITATGLTGTAASNYTLGTVTPGTLTISTLGISATANPATMSYGQVIPALTGTLTGVLAQDSGNVSPVFSTTATSTSPLGSYPISVTLSGSAASNYKVTLTNSAAAQVTIQAATISLSVNNASRNYGTANPTFTGAFTAVLAQDQANVSANFTTAATTTSSVGSYPITASALSGSAAGNYVLGTVTPGALSITPLGITATPAPVTATYGQAIPAITGTLSGVLAQDQGNVSATYSTTATSASPVGTYPIAVQLSGTDSSNYTVSLSGAATVKIQPVVVAVTVNSATRAYGSANPTFTGTINGVLAPGAANVAVSFATTATATSATGKYPITSSGLTGSAAGNYSLGTVTAGTLTITQATSSIAVTTSSATVALGTQPTFTATVTPGTSGTPTGSVTFNDGTTELGTATMTDGVATYSPALTAGAHTISAVYSGDKDFTGSTSSSIAETVQLPIVTVPTPPASPVTISSGSSGTVPLQLSAQGGYTGTATLSCTNLPAGMTCSFNPATLTFSSTSATASTTLTISTSATTASAQMSAPRAPGKGNNLTAIPALCFWVPGSLLGLLGLRKRNRSSLRRLMLLTVAIAGMAGMAMVTGCGGSSSAAKVQPGTYNIQVEITAGTVQTIPISVVVQ